MVRGAATQGTPLPRNLTASTAEPERTPTTAEVNAELTRGLLSDGARGVWNFRMEGTGGPWRGLEEECRRAEETQGR